MDVSPQPVSGRRLLLALLLWPLIWALLLGLVVLLVAGLAGFGWLRSHRPDVGAFATATAYLGLLAALMVAFGGPAGLRDRLGFRYTSFRDLLLAVAAWLGALVAGSFLTALVTYVQKAPPPDNAVQVLRLSLDPVFVGILVPTIVILAPLCEELFFRGALFGWLWRRFNLTAAVLVSAAAFAGAHLILSLFPFLFVFGVAAALVYRWTGSTLNSFLMHACQNGLAVMLAYYVIANG
jgi:membrane protease YdiL (CAAX protease family)